MSSAPLDTLAGIPFFSGVGKRHLKQLVASAKEVSHEPGRVLAQEGLGALAFHLILDGTAEVLRDDTVVRELRAGDYFGEISMIDGRRRSATVTATSPLSTLAVPHLAFQDLLDDEPEVARQILVRLCDRLREAEAAD